MTYDETGIKFELDKDFVNKYADKEAPFGFNGAGFLAYFRSYSRKPDGKKEKWHETVERVVNGTYSIQKRHITERGLGWNKEKAQRSAQEMYDRMFNMKFLPPGRGLWAMGSPITEEKGLFAALNNCSMVSTKDLKENPTEPFEFMMDMSMCGVGVGFDTKGAGTISIGYPNHANTIREYTVPDSREGWVESLKLLLEEYFSASTARWKFDYSEIRPKGAPIKTFGGIAPGPEPLKKLHKQIREQFDGRRGEEITSRDIVDLMNKIGVCVVSGNVRRSAEIAFGDPDDEDYLKLKDYSWDGEKYVGKEKDRASFGWVSNNSIFADIGMDYSNHAEQTAHNGEPGYAWLENAKKHGRMNGKEEDYKDRRSIGMNPCMEQTLESWELCCLVETFPSRAENLEDFKRTLKFAYLYAKTVTLCNTHWTETNRVMMRNRRIGCSMSGITQFLDRNSIKELKSYCEEGYDTVQYYDKVYSDWFCVPKSIKTTSVKPSGTVSLLPGVTPGVHFPEDNHYIRRITLDKGSDIADACRAAGYKVEDAIDDETAVKVEIPVSIENVRTVDEVSMWEQLSLAAFMQKYWADNQVSCTVTFQEDEADQIEHALNYFQYQLKGISFLPKTEQGEYPQMPYESISKEKYEKLHEEIERIQFEGDGLDAIAEKFCDNDTCEI